MTSSSFEDDILARLANALVAALGMPGNPVLKELQSIVAVNEAKLAAQINQGLSAMITNPAFKALLVSAIKGALPFPLLKEGEDHA